MQRQKILQVTQQKHDFVRQMLKEGKSGPEIKRVLKKKFRSGVNDSLLARIRREIAKAEVTTEGPLAPDEILVIPPPEQPNDRELHTRLGGVLNWMAAEGINKISLDLASRQMELERVEVIRC